MVALGDDGDGDGDVDEDGRVSQFPTRRAMSDACTMPSFSFQLSERTVKSSVPSLALRYVSVMFFPQQDREPEPFTVPRDTSSHETVLQE